jgi:decaprenylphospho-beta-D-ribofuranose 2-oxidase
MSAPSPTRPDLREELARRRLEPSRVARVCGFGMALCADGYRYRPGTIEEVRQVLQLARETGRQVVLRGAGRSYGDASIGAECLILDITRMRSILSWDRETGVIDCQGGVTIEGLWRHTLEDGWWPPVVSGTMYPTLAGALGMNIHGKNNFREGTLGEHVRELEVMFPSGETRVLTPKDDLFYAVVSGFGMLGVIVRVKLQMKRVRSGDLRVLPVSCAGWDDQFAAMERFEPHADYMVSWIDCFGRGRGAGRGLFHAAWYLDEPLEHPATLLETHQDLPDTILGLVPKSTVWRMLKLLNRRTGMRGINLAKFRASRTLGDGKPHAQSLVGFSFLLDYVPNWRWAYLPGGFIQYQSFVPKEHARRVFAEQVRMQQAEGLESYLGVLKRHRPDRFLVSHAVDGYSLALDFKVTPKNWERVQRLAHRMNDLVLEAGGRFYLAKDATLRPEDFRNYMGEEALAKLRELKSEHDPDNLLTSELAKRLQIFDFPAV